MFSKKNSCDKKVTKGFTLVEIIVVLVILAILAAATIPSMLGFIDDAKFKTIDNEVRVVRNAAQAYATEQSAKGETDEDIQNQINGVINSNHALHNFLQNDANGTVFETKVEKGKIRKFNYTKEIVNQDENVITDKVRYVVFDDEKTSLLHATGSVTNIDIDDFKADVIAALKTNFRTELGSNVVDLVYPVGSYYVSHSSTSPETLFSGTTWTKVVNEFLYCVDPDDGDVTPGTTGGSSTHIHTTGSHTLTVSEIPSHNHSFVGNNATGGFNVRHSSAENHLSVWGGSGVFSISRTTESAGAGLQISENSGKANIISFSMTPSGSIGNTGSGSAHSHGNTGSSSNMPPYMRVYCWRRTA